MSRYGCSGRHHQPQVAHPYRGPRHDLHAAAHRFLKEWGFFARSETGLKPENVFLEPTLLNKLHRIGSLGCSAFVDDLPGSAGRVIVPKRCAKGVIRPQQCASPSRSDPCDLLG